MMELRGPAQRLTILVGATHQHQHRPLYTEIVHRAHAFGLAGASVLRGIEGFGRSRHLHTSRILSLSDDLPIAVIIVDTSERIAAFLPELEGLVGGGLVMVDDVHVISYGGNRTSGRSE